MLDADNKARERINDIFSNRAEKYAKLFLDDFNNDPVSDFEKEKRQEAAKDFF